MEASSPASLYFSRTYSAVRWSSGEPATCGTAVSVCRCCFASMGLGTSRNVCSAFNSFAGSWKPKILSGGLNAGAAAVDVSWLGAMVERVRAQARTALNERTNPDLLVQMRELPTRRLQQPADVGEFGVSLHGDAGLARRWRECGWRRRDRALRAGQIQQRP